MPLYCFLWDSTLTLSCLFLFTIVSHSLISFEGWFEVPTQSNNSPRSQNKWHDTIFARNAKIIITGNFSWCYIEGITLLRSAKCGNQYASGQWPSHPCSFPRFQIISIMQCWVRSSSHWSGVIRWKTWSFLSPNALWVNYLKLERRFIASKWKHEGWCTQNHVMMLKCALNGRQLFDIQLFLNFKSLLIRLGLICGSYKSSCF